MTVNEHPRTEETTTPVQTAPPVITVEGLSVFYNGDPALDKISFTVREGERLAIIGPNGAGKSTLIKVIMGLLQPRGGRVTVAAPGRGRLGYVPQHERVNWDFPVTVRDVVMMGRARHIGWFRWPRRTDWDAVHLAVERVGLTDYCHRQVGELSGGQRRRVFIARALAQDSDTLILDEPFAGVDAGAQAGLMDVLDDLNRDGITILFTTHDLDLAFHRFDKVMALRERLVAYGTPAETYTPETLAALYDGKLARLEDGRVTLFVDDPGCQGC